MSPRKFVDDDHKPQLISGIVINGPRPTPLKLKQESHTIQKHHHKQQQQQQIRKPIIIYIHSPEIIHTKPHDFMALVQRLTGNDSRSKDQQQQKKKKKTLKQKGGFDLNDNEFSSDSGVTHERDKGLKSKSPLFNTPSNPYVADIPLFTPNTSDYFFLPQRFLKLSDMVSSSPNVNTSLSPGSLVELMKELPDQY
ncbi:hypothetical protein L1987_61758 [Smallanthus sonchifolius]|uniref:Uncharacterized protein n=1 Tax=Smallanthus sonchifolius TaxID=185202 RepID=A0ACB9C8U4_9ASTR|nr:hypothetical protein L1987_61758 [Smallanthus sonchifolius]